MSLYKIIKHLSPVFFILFIIMSLQSVHSQSSVYYYSVRPQISIIYLKGDISLYSDASKFKISNDNPLSFIEEVYIKNSDSHLWIAVRTLIPGTLRGIGLFFDTDHDQQFADDGKILFLNQSSEEGYYVGDSGFSLQNSPNFDSKVTTITFLGASNLLFEFKINLDTSTPTKDLQIPDPTDFLLGFDLVSIHSSTMFSEAIGEISNYSNNATNYATLVLAGPGKFAVPDFVPETVTSAPPPSPSTTNGAASTAYVTNTAAETNQAAAGAAPGFTFNLPSLILFISMGFIIKKRRKLK